MIRPLHRVSRGVRVLAMFVACFGTLAAAAQGAKLKVSVSPAAIPKGTNYRVKVSGTYAKSELTGRAYLIAVIQYSAAPCKATAQLENNLQPQFYLAKNQQQVGVFETKSPFSRTDTFGAVVLGTRRVCAYLYPKVVGPADTTAPIATASAKYTVLKKR
ncbi:MAG TPA: hypothetical protein VMU39_22610 [Solirubrobacteraceae bacterium]|nr:hypothetical protein [Solirubrobacteraceae bacterium]